MELKEKAKSYTPRKKGRQAKEIEKNKKPRFDVKRALGTEVKLPGMDRPDRFIPELKQGTYENIKRFTKRVENVCNVSAYKYLA